MAKRQKFLTGQLVRVKQYGGRIGDVLYEVVTVFANGLDCTIREVGPRADKVYRAQRFDTSLLVPADALKDLRRR